jgi:hypothetical protein
MLRSDEHVFRIILMDGSRVGKAQTLVYILFRMQVGSGVSKESTLLPLFARSRRLGPNPAWPGRLLRNATARRTRRNVS